MKNKKGRSGYLKATNDTLIYELLNDSHYRVNPNGIVLTIITRTGKVSVNGVWRVAGHRDSGGYWSIKYKDHTLRRSRIVYAHFKGKLSEDLVINHIDGNKINDCPENIELVPQRDNNIHRFQTLGHKPVIGHYVLDFDVAEQIRKEKKIGKSHNEIAIKFGISKGHVSEIVNNKIWVTP